MSNNIFPTLVGQDISVDWTPQFSTRIQTAISGRELRAAFYSAPLYTIKLTFNVLRSDALFAEFQQLAGFFLVQQGSFDSFLFDNIDDNTVTDQLIGIGNGSNTTFQLVRALGTYVEPVMNRNVVTNIKVDGVPLSGTDYSIGSTGLVTLVTPPMSGKTVTWTGTFYYRCRFTNDTADFKRFLYKLFEYKSCEFIGCLGNKI